MINWLNKISPVWADYITLMTFQNCIFLGAILMLLYVLRKKKVTLLRGIALIGLIKLFIPPFISVSTHSVETVSSYIGTVFPVPDNAALVETARTITLSVKSCWMICWFFLLITFTVYVVIKYTRLRMIVKRASPVSAEMHISAAIGSNVTLFKSCAISHMNANKN